VKNVRFSCGALILLILCLLKNKKEEKIYRLGKVQLHVEAVVMTAACLVELRNDLEDYQVQE